MTEAACVETNPLLKPWTAKHGLPPFKSVEHGHYKPAIMYAAKLHIEEMKEISLNSTPETFDNTIAAFDCAGDLLNNILCLFFNQTSSMCPPELQEVEMELSGPLAEHQNTIFMYPGLFSRINTVYLRRHEELTIDGNPLNSEQIRLVERIHLDFTRAGANFDLVMQEKYSKIVVELAELTTQFSQNILMDETNYFLEIDDLSGLSSDMVDAAKQAAIERNKSDSHAITLSRSSVEPFLTFSNNRSLREEAWRAWVSRGQMVPERDNFPIMKKILSLRQEQALCHGYDCFAAYATADSMAQTPDKVMDLLKRVWQPAKESCNREQTVIEESLKRELPGDTLQPWDWRFYAEKIRGEKYDFDAGELKPYLPLDAMVGALFDCANQLFGLKFVQIEVDSYHPDVQTYEVYKTVEGVDRLQAIFLHDNFSRMYKNGGAWMSEYRVQSNSGDSPVIPIIVNNNNFSKAAEGQRTLLTFDDAVTLFHEFGHGMHGMLSDVTYRSLAGTAVLRDFVEFPSQLFEHWLSEPEVLLKHAKHVVTGDTIPTELIARMTAANNFNKGFDTVEYLSSALVDQALHSCTVDVLNAPEFNVSDFEAKELACLGMPSAVVMRHRPGHFLHIFGGSSYAAAYYVYLWAEVLDADGFEAFKQSEGGIFDPVLAGKLLKNVYSAGNSIEPGEAFRLFRGQDPAVEPMLRKKCMI